MGNIFRLQRKIVFTDKIMCFHWKELCFHYWEKNAKMHVPINDKYASTTWKKVFTGKNMFFY